MIMITFIHTETDWNAVKKQRFSFSLPRFSKVVTTEENQLISAGFEFSLRQDWRICAPVRIGCSFGDFAVRISRNAVKRNLNAFCRTAACRVQNMRGEIAGHPSPLFQQ